MTYQRLKSIIFCSLFSWNSFCLIFGVIGVALTIWAMFICNWNEQVSVKWIALQFVVFLYIVVALIKALYETCNKQYIECIPIEFDQETRTFLIPSNEYLDYYSMVSIVQIKNKFEIDFGTGYVSNIQKGFIQITVISLKIDDKQLKELMKNDSILLNKLRIKITYKYEGIK